MTQTNLLYFQDNYQTNFSSSITQIDKDERCIILEATMFYPRGGNQDSDTGYLEYDGKRFGVTKVSKDKLTGEVCHYIGKDNSDKLSDLEIGATMFGEIDWPKRYVHMKTHTAQHLLSSLLTATYKADTIDVEITYEYGEIKTSRALDYAEIINIQNHANELVSKGIKTSRSIIDSRYHLKIGEVDVRECGGTHVSNLSEIEQILVVKVEDEKLFYVIGNSAKHKLGEMQYDALKARSLYPKDIGNIHDFQAYVHNLQEEKSSLSRKISSISEELLRLRISSIGNQEQSSIFLLEAQELSTKEVKSIIDSATTISDTCFVILCKNRSLVISSSSTLAEAGSLLNFLKLKDQNIKGGGNKKFAQGGPWNMSYSELNESILEYPGSHN
jgi:Ser-tRNA(Ala) deacylase AlaX